MKLQVLLSAMHLEDETYIDSLNITGDAVVINQCDRESEKNIERVLPDGRKQQVRYIETCERGLSKSRNMAIRNCDSDVFILCDNDVEYVPGYEQMIQNAFETHPEADLIVFYIKRPEKPVPNYPTERKMDYLSVLKIFSPEIAVRRKSIAGIEFNERFGAGAEYKMGEENIFLYDCLKAGLAIIYMPVMIAQLREEESTWFMGYDERFFYCRGANYAAMSRWFSIVLIMQFALRKTSLYKDKVPVLRAIKQMFKGRREYLNDNIRSR